MKKLQLEAYFGSSVLILIFISQWFVLIKLLKNVSKMQNHKKGN